MSLYPTIPTLNTRDKTSIDGAFLQALLSPTFVDIIQLWRGTEHPFFRRTSTLSCLSFLSTTLRSLQQVNTSQPAIPLTQPLLVYLWSTQSPIPGILYRRRSSTPSPADNTTNMAPLSASPSMPLLYTEPSLIPLPSANEDGETNYTFGFGICGTIIAVAALVVAMLQLRKTRAMKKVYELA